MDKQTKSLKEKQEKSPKQLERHLKGLAHSKRIHILILLGKNGEKGRLASDLEEAMKLNPKNLSHHATKLQLAGLVDKQFRGGRLVLTLSPYGKSIYKLLTTFSQS